MRLLKGLRDKAIASPRTSDLKKALAARNAVILMNYTYLPPVRCVLSFVCFVSLFPFDVCPHITPFRGKPYYTMLISHVFVGGRIDRLSLGTRYKVCLCSDHSIISRSITVST
jgi:hypothetical protein